MSKGSAKLCENILNDMTMHVGEAALDAIVVEAEFFVVDAKLV